MYVDPFSYNGRASEVVDARQNIGAISKDNCAQKHCRAGHYLWNRRVRVLKLEPEFSG